MLVQLQFETATGESAHEVHRIIDFPDMSRITHHMSKPIR
jgi:hypothetical protein